MTLMSTRPLGHSIGCIEDAPNEAAHFRRPSTGYIFGPRRSTTRQRRKNGAIGRRWSKIRQSNISKQTTKLGSKRETTAGTMTSMAPCHPQLKIDACFHMGRLQSVGKFQVGHHFGSQKSTERRLWVKQFAFFCYYHQKDRLSDSDWKMQITGEQETKEGQPSGY
jgi:hypothetical protein